MDVLCRVCEQSIMENESQYYHYLATLHKKNAKSLYKRYSINNIKLDDVNKIINDYISTQKKNFDFYFTNCDIVIEFDINFIANIETSYFYKTDIININSYLLYDIDFLNHEDIIFIKSIK